MDGPLRSEAPYPADEPFTLLYCGRFGIGARDPVILLRALKIARQSGADIRLRILGDDSANVREAVAAHELEHAVSVHGPVPHGEAVNALLAAHALVLYQQPSLSPVTAVAGKTHEYLRAGRPILAIAPEGDNLRIIRQHAPVWRCVSTYEATEIAAAMAELKALHPFDPSQLQASARHMRRFSRKALTEKLAKHFLSIARKGGNSC